MSLWLILCIVSVVFILGCVIISLRRVVNTNEVHIIQNSKTTVSYGKDSGNGNVYYEWYSWIPYLGVTKTVLTTSVFDLALSDYEAYDKGRLPFKVDIMAFFRISDSNTAAQRVSSFKELYDQLSAVVQGAVRTILASSDIEEIMQGRSKFGTEFTREVEEQLKSWGVSAVKNIELMDIRDSSGSKVIANIMEKKKSMIEMESRTEVANNKQVAEIAELKAKQEVELQRQSVEQQVGLRETEVQRNVQLAQQKQQQEIIEEKRVTKMKEMAVIQTEQSRKAEIDKEVTLINAEKTKQQAIIVADANIETTKRNASAVANQQIIVAEANLAAKKCDSEAIQVEGEAKAAAEKALQMVPVYAQTTLAKEIGENQGYQQYLIRIEEIKVSRDIGIEQAKALMNADLKIIANAGNANEGLTKAGEILSSNTGTKIGSMLEGLANTGIGKELLDRFTKK